MTNNVDDAATYFKYPVPPIKWYEVLRQNYIEMKHYNFTQLLIACSSVYDGFLYNTHHVEWIELLFSFPTVCWTWLLDHFNLHYGWIENGAPKKDVAIVVLEQK